MYSTLLLLWPVEELAGLADEPSGIGEVARGGCLFAWNFSVTRSTVLNEGREKTLDQIRV
jgi:hypothetical protein